MRPVPVYPPSIPPAAPINFNIFEKRLLFAASFLLPCAIYRFEFEILTKRFDWNQLQVLPYSPLDDLAPPVGVQLRMLPVPQVHLELLLSPGVETEVGLIGEVVRMEEHLDEARFRDEGLRLLALAAEHARVLAVANVRLSVAVYNL